MRLTNFISYAPDLEDFILFFLLHDIYNGFYIDVGANDPNLLSVTKVFYERGWNGINNINLNLGAGNYEGKSVLLIRGLAGYWDTSTLCYKKNNSKTINIKISTMSNICKKYVPKGIQIQFCKIDVEGYEKNVLLGYDFINNRPKIFCIESLINDKTKIGEYKEWEYILKLNDYEFGYKYKVNRYYYDKRINGLKEKFLEIQHYVQLYQK